MSKRIQEFIPTHRLCTKCHKPMAVSIQSDLCPSCHNEILYKEVKEYIQNNDVTELEVADKFNLPLSQIKNWIKDGRLVYKNNLYHSDN